MSLQEEMETYLEEVEQKLSGFEDDLEAFFSTLETQENPFSKEADSNALTTYEWVPRTKVNPAQRRAKEKYEQWYGAVEPVVYEYLPRRHEEFTDSRQKVIKHINLNMGLFDSVPEDPMEKAVEIIDLVDGQRSMVKAAPNRIVAKRFNARKEISANIEQNEIERAKQLFRDELIRESGVIAGVALERHLLTMCEISEKDVNYNPDHSIERLAQSLYKANEIEQTPMKYLSFLGDIRGDCAHPSGELDSQMVKRLLDGAEQFIRDGFDN